MQDKKSIKPILAYGSPLLHLRCQPVPRMDAVVADLLASMYSTMRQAQGVGLAAPQVGEGIRLFVALDVEAQQGEADAVLTIINPEVVWTSREQVSGQEGCLSIPEEWVDVRRPAHVRLRYRDAAWREREELFTGFMARVVQHEYDHLEGKLITDGYSAAAQKALARRMVAMETESFSSLTYPMKLEARAEG